MSKKKNSKENSERQESAFGRRTFMQGVGFASAAVALGNFKQGSSALAAEPGNAVKGAPALANIESGVLRRSPVVMLWRRVSDLNTASSFVSKTLKQPAVGKDPTSVMFDAGGALVGYSIREVAASAQIQQACSLETLRDFSLQNNPASLSVYAPKDFDTSLQGLYEVRGMGPVPAAIAANDNVAFLDDDGNFSSFSRPSAYAQGEKVGSKLLSILSNHWPTLRANSPTANIPNPLIGIDLLVSDVAASKKFYSEVLGLEALHTGATEAKFDIGTMILSLKLEPSSRLVSFLNKTGRLLGDWVVFHVQDIRSATKALERRGVKFPHGIETSVIGDVGYFNDPDGHSLVLWQPSGKTKMINFTPQLQRILKMAEEAAI
ncbi:MAG TPA: VOC family protein [Pyrinomonadaceae bacterium]|nr:VOC family protein [Pyrinomonadaceae bacterium]